MWRGRRAEKMERDQKALCFLKEPGFRVLLQPLMTLTR